MSGEAKTARWQKRARARFCQLIERALFELKLALDLARAEGYAEAEQVAEARRRLAEAVKER